jgi:WD40 repeat protein
MIIYENENILKLILTSIPLVDIKNSKTAMNKTIQYIILQITDFKKMFETMGKNKTTIKAHNTSITSLLQISNSYIVTACQDGLIKVWAIRNFQCIKTLGQKSSVASVVNLPNEQFASSCTSHINIWDISVDFNCLKTLSYSPYRYYNNLVLLSDGNLAVSASELVSDYVLILNSQNNYNLIKAIYGDGRNITSLIALSNSIIAYSAFENQIKIWGQTNMKFLGIRISYFDDYKCLRTLISYYVTKLIHIEKENLLVSGSREGKINIWNLSDYQCLHMLYACSEVCSLLLLPGGFYASGLYDGSIKIWEIKGHKGVNILESEKPVVTSLVMLKDNRLISSTGEGTIIIWN